MLNMQYNVPNYNLMSNYINNLADSRLKGDNEQNDILLQSHYFDRNNLRGNKTELNNQLKDITAQIDYGKAPQQSRPTIIDKLDEGSPQDKLNERQYAMEMSPIRRQDHDAINPYIQPHKSDINYGNRFPHPCYGNRRNRCSDWSLTKTIVIVIVLLGIFYLLLSLMFQDRVDRQYMPGNMNLYDQLPPVESNQ
jgi:hypothetical protein